MREEFDIAGVLSVRNAYLMNILQHLCALGVTPTHCNVYLLLAPSVMRSMGFSSTRTPFSNSTSLGMGFSEGDINSLLLMIQVAVERIVMLSSTH